jgi:hypothetical protein
MFHHNHGKGKNEQNRQNPKRNEEEKLKRQRKRLNEMTLKVHSWSPPLQLKSAFSVCKELQTFRELRKA